MKTFENDLYFFLNKIKANQPFSLSRWGDGELMILDNTFIDIRSKGDGEFRYDPNLTEYVGVRSKLINSYHYYDNEYYIGVACKCCVGDEKHQYMKNKSRQSEDKLTWANIFVNSNYKKFIDLYIPEFSNHKINLVVNKNAKINGLPFSVNKAWYVGADAWLNDYNIVSDISKYIIDNNVKDEIFLFAAGPLANILTYELWSFVSKNNTYIDIGSVLDPYLKLKLTRGYQLGAQTLNKICIW